VFIVDARRLPLRTKDDIMKALRRIGVPSLLAIPAAIAFAQAASQPNTGESRAQVKAEATEAVREGDFEVGDTGRKANQINPNRYPKAPAAVGETRAQVKAELDTARREGSMPVGDVGDTPREISPKAFPAEPTAPGLTRAEVKAQAKSAARAGDVQVGDSGKTLAEENPPRYAGAPAKPPKLQLHLPHKATQTSASASTSAN
jgi:hypothetical protein